jgi:rhamnosyltransferase
MTKVSIVVRALDEAEHLPALYTGLLRQRRRPDEIILVDSGSTDATIAISEAHGATVVHIDPAEFSFGRALNRGCSHATGDVLVFVSAHVYPLDEYWLERMVEPFADPDVGLVYGRQTGDHRSRFSELQLFLQWFPAESDPNQSTPFCNNANCAVRADAWRELPYDETLTGLEDLDWAKRASDKWWRLVYEARATIAHIHEETYDHVRTRYRREAIAHRRIFQDQHLNLPSAAGLFLLTVGRDYLSAIRRRRLLRNLGSIPAFRAAQYLGTWEGFHHRGEVSISLRKRFYYPKGFGSPSRRTESSAPR